MICNVELNPGPETYISSSRKNLLASTKTQVYVQVSIKQIYNIEEIGDEQ
jgi:hypothetical protein